jgi:crossover junction endodeoxyribonuclease RusA
MTANSPDRVDLLLAFDVPGPPVPKARPRRNPRHGRHYTPRKTQEAEDRIAAVASSAWAGRHMRPWEKPVLLEAVFWLPSKRRVDLDNLLKTVTDALNGVVYKDDSLIWSLTAAKAFSTDRPRTEVWVYDWAGLAPPAS